MKPKPTLLHFLALAGSSLLTVSSATAQIIYDWKSDSPDGNWRRGADGARWFNNSNSDNLWDEPPTGTGAILRFNNNHQLTMTNNVSGTYNIHGLTFGSSNTSARTINSGTIRFFDFSGTDPFITNSSSATHVINSTLQGDGTSDDPLKININGSGGLTFGGTINNQGSWIDVAGSTTTPGTAVTFGSVISGSGGLYVDNTNLLVNLNAANGYTGATTVNGGELRWGVSNAIAGGALNINNGGTVNMQGFSDGVGAVTIAKGGAITGTTAILTAPSLVSNNGGSISFPTGSLVLTGNLTYNDTISGSTMLSIDRLDVRSATIFNIARGDDASGVDFDITSQIFSNGNGRNITKSGSGVMRLSGATASGTSGHLGNGTLSIQDGTLIFNKSGEVNAFGGGGLFTIGDGTGSANTAVLRYETNSNQIGGNAITINSDGLFDLNGFSESIGSALTMNGGSLTTGAGTLFLGGTTNTISGASTVTGNLTFNRSSGNANILILGGTASINGATTFTGDSNTGITATGDTSIAGTLAFGTANRTIAVTNASDVLTISATTSGTGTLIKSGAGTLITTAASALPQYATSGKVVINGGTLGVRVGGSGWTTTEVNTLLTNATKTSGALGIDTTNGDLTQWTAFTTTNLGSTLGLNKLGSNTLTLDQANTYTGPTTVSAGTLLINGSTSSTSLVTVNNGATLGGTGTVGGAVTVNGALKPGNSTGLLTVGSLDLTASATTTFEINGTNRGALANGYDALGLNSGGSLDLAGALVFEFGNLAAFANNTEFDLFSFDTTSTGDFASVVSTGFYAGTWGKTGDVWSLTSGSQTLNFSEVTGNLVVVPEPRAALLGGLGLLVLLRRRRA